MGIENAYGPGEGQESTETPATINFVDLASGEATVPEGEVSQLTLEK